MKISEAEKTENGTYCEIPFEYRGIEYYTCNSLYKCQTVSGFFTCQRGYFLYARTSLNGDPFVAQLKFNEIKLAHSGFYLLTFHIFMYCNKSECMDANDFIQLDLKLNHSTESIIYRLNELENERRWLKKHILIDNFEMENDLEISFYFFRLIKVSTIGYFGVDHVELIRLMNDTLIDPTNLITRSTTAKTTQTENQITNTTMPSLVSSRLVYTCDFDESECNSTRNLNGTSSLAQFVYYFLITTTSYRITDITSISRFYKFFF